MTEREKTFVNYFSLTVYTMKVAEYSADMAMKYCGHSGVKNVIASCKTKVKAGLLQLIFSLRSDSRKMINDDLNSDDLMAYGAILHELVDMGDISGVEDDIIKLIRDRKQVKEMV